MGASPKLTASMIGRQMLWLISRRLRNVEFGGDAPSIGYPSANLLSFQRSATIQLVGRDFSRGLEEFSERFLLDEAIYLTYKLANARTIFRPPFPPDQWFIKGRSAAVHIFDGTSIRCLIEPLAFSMTLKVRFDVVGSPMSLDEIRSIDKTIAA